MRMTTKTRARFELGQTVATTGAVETMARYHLNAGTLLDRHAAGDWGDLGERDKDSNEIALVAGDRILSAYGSGDAKLWVITEWDRSVTTILRPDEY
jgi:hypothetical protein